MLLASIGNSNPLEKNVNILMKIKPMHKRIMLTDKDPTFKLADSNAKAVIVQKIAVPKAANSPIFDCSHVD